MRTPCRVLPLDTLGPAVRLTKRPTIAFNVAGEAFKWSSASRTLASQNPSVLRHTSFPSYGDHTSPAWVGIPSYRAPEQLPEQARRDVEAAYSDDLDSEQEAYAAGVRGSSSPPPAPPPRAPPPPPCGCLVSTIFYINGKAILAKLV